MADVLLVGATGMVGRAVSAAFEPRPLMMLTRRGFGQLPGTQIAMIADSSQWAEKIAAVRPAIVLNALGTTIRQAGSQAAFCAVDHDLVLAVARAAKAAGARHFISVSSVGADATSRNFYLRTKGAAEAALRALAFERLDILRPGLLTGQRQGPFRAGEALAMLAAPLTDALLHGSLRRYRSIPAASVARAMVALAGGGGSGTFVHEHDAIVQLAD